MEGKNGKRVESDGQNWCVGEGAGEQSENLVQWNLPGIYEGYYNTDSYYCEQSHPSHLLQSDKVSSRRTGFLFIELLAKGTIEFTK